MCFINEYFQIIVSAILACAWGQNNQGRRSPQPFQKQQQYNQIDDDNSQQYQNENIDRQQYHSQVKSEPNERIRSTTFIPIIRFDKEQGIDGSYKAS